jgi:hypothetical protein
MFSPCCSPELDYTSQTVDVISEHLPRCASFESLQQRSASFDLPLSTGDVICIKGRADQVTRLGATGGYMGHVLLVLAPPVGLQRNSAEAMTYLNIWPRNTRTMWIVKTGESCRAAEGFKETELLMHIDERGQFMIVGEQDASVLYKHDSPAKAQLFCCPPELREQCNSKDMNNILKQMRNREGNWSWGTAVRAFLLSADVSDGDDFETIKMAWKSDPICTSVVISFWQRYLCKLADTLPDEDAMDWIRDWMPVMADRALPGELMSTMEKCGWTVLDSMHEGRNRCYSF